MSQFQLDEESIFDLARKIESPEARIGYLDQVCGTDNELKDRVVELLQANDAEASFLDRPPAELDPTIESSRVREKPGDTIGPYKLLQQLGEGGMGVVYMAEQKVPIKRRVALKIIKPGMDTRQVIARFEAERQALAMMDHPNIAKMLDAGQTDSGRPYFVMELVNGLPVTKYCDEQHLTPEERLELFVPICQAVQHAHQKGIIHRDLKPSNILVALYDGLPVPKIIDFGVAKATSQTLTEKTMFTHLGQVVGTLGYMSPEQAERNQLDIDTRSDIYSLGVVLYELLVGETPFDRKRLRSAAFEEMLRIIREEEPPRPSTKLSSSGSLPSIAANRHIEPQRLSLLVRGELDWIVMKAMDKDRTRRYESASMLAEDIGHFLKNEQVLACPPSAAYRIKKFAWQYRSLLTILGFLVAVLLVTASMSIWLYVAERGKRRLADDLALANTMELAKSYESEGKFVEAARAYQDILKINLDRGDESITVRQRMANAHAKADNLDAAIAEYELILERQQTTLGENNPEVVNIRRMLVDSVIARSTQIVLDSTSKKRDRQRAVELAEHAVELSRSDETQIADALLCLSISHYRNGDLKSARHPIVEYLTCGARGNDVAFYLLLAGIHHRLGETDVAKSWILAADNLWPGGKASPQRLIEYEWLRTEVKQQVFGEPNLPVRRTNVAEKERVYSDLIDAYPGAPKLRRNRGYCRIQLGNWTGAATDFADAQRMTTARLAYYDVCLAWMLWHQGRRSELEKVQRRLFDALQEEELYQVDERSIAAFQLLVTAEDQDYSQLIYERFGSVSLEGALATYRLRRYQEAIRLLETQLAKLEAPTERESRTALARLFLAMAYSRNGDDNEARRELAEAREFLLKHSPRPGQAFDEKHTSYFMSVIWCEPLGALAEAEEMINGELSPLSQKVRLRAQSYN